MRLTYAGPSKGYSLHTKGYRLSLPDEAMAMRWLQRVYGLSRQVASYRLELARKEFFGPGQQHPTSLTEALQRATEGHNDQR